jgi:hypothetical protein
VVISHHKVNGLANHGRSAQTLALIERQMRSQPIGSGLLSIQRRIDGVVSRSRRSRIAHSSDLVQAAS